MRLLVLGASGGCGRWVTRFAARDGHDVTALVRRSTIFQAPPGVCVQRGSVLDPNDLAHAIDGKDVVISCIGPQRTNPRNPWAPLRPPPQVAELSVRAIAVALTVSRVRRFAAISAAGVGDSFGATNRLMQWLIRHSTIGAMYADLDAMEQVLRRSNLDWLAVRPVTLVNAAPSRRAKRLKQFRAASVIGRADVAAFLLRAATDPAPVTERTPMLGWW